MATGILSDASQLVMPDLQECNLAPGTEYLKQVSQFVSRCRHQLVKLKKPVGATLTIAQLEDTIYRDEDDEVNGWGKFYLPKIVNMQVVGVVDGIPCPCKQLVLMTCEDKKMYAYDGEELHVVASSLNCLDDKGIEYPSSKSYYNGEAFKDMSEEDWEEVRRGPVGRRLEKEHQKLVAEHRSAFLECLE
ncbi:uncharacterized protein LOC108900372 [Lates calcarifer]|uniref:Uncharacterized protein LOC108900372 n=1 Tax=Lates calcarifer TaxID=8187 RepID=A0AAJ7QIQ4_LATCA|nr:uncharacterized protein LOC108900372 [Lates calcarifer]XP_050921509.1 uncharacterized protein LOC108900372 [Lates calcarifer]